MKDWHTKDVIIAKFLTNRLERYEIIESNFKELFSKLPNHASLSDDVHRVILQDDQLIVYDIDGEQISDNLARQDILAKLNQCVLSEFDDVLKNTGTLSLEDLQFGAGCRPAGGGCRPV